MSFRRVSLLILAAAILASTIAIGGCGPKQTLLDIRGSDTMVNLGAAWAEAYMAKYRHVTIAVMGGGSGTGIKSLIDKNCTIAMASRAIKSSEMDQGKAAGLDIREVIVAHDGVAMVVHPSNPVTEMTLANLGRIFRGEVTNWKEVGGSDAAIAALSRDTASGTHVFVKELVVQQKETIKGAEYGPDVQFLPSTAAIVTEVSQNPNAIGYVGLGYLTQHVKPLGVKKDAGSPAVLPSATTVKNKTYEVARPLFLYLPGEAQGKVKKYIDWILGAEGQQTVEKLGFVTVK